jgi:2-polyprenyl-3-methyl-5-hydroxy-6-metoxy-1,4-benzoquinol methylase
LETVASNSALAQVICEVCGSRGHTQVPAPWPILRCSQCGLTFAPQSKTEDAPELYDESFTRASKHPTYIFDGENYSLRAGEVWSRHFSKLSKYKKTGRILDIGCSLGFLLNHARQFDWEPYGVEVSPYAVEYAQKKLNIKVEQGILQHDTFPNSFFDVVICSHVVEHVPSPRMLIRLIRNVLRPGGVVLILVPTQFASLSYRVLGKVRGEGPPLHLYFFSRRTLSSLLAQEGFSVVESEMNTELAHLVGAFTASKKLENKLENQSEQIINHPSKTPIERLRNAAVKAGKTIINQTGTALDFGDELIIYAEKTDSDNVPVK